VNGVDTLYFAHKVSSVSFHVAYDGAVVSAAFDDGGDDDVIADGAAADAAVGGVVYAVDGFVVID
jgi:hypothetical protein